MHSIRRDRQCVDPAGEPNLCSFPVRCDAQQCVLLHAMKIALQWDLGKGWLLPCAFSVTIFQARPMRHPPQRIKSTEVIERTDGRERTFLDDVAVEEPLEIRIGTETVTITMRTPGDDFALAAGFLYAEGLIGDRLDVSRINYGRGRDDTPSGNVVTLTLRPSLQPDLGALRRNFVSASSCGICGRTSMDAVHAREVARPNPHFTMSAEILVQLPALLRSAQRVFGRTGGLHAAGLFDARGELLLVREDIGRHNAVDKVIGDSLRQGILPLSDHVLLVSGRGGFEIVQKAIAAGVPVLASVSAPSSLAVQLAREGGVTLVGFLRERRFVLYSHPQRVR
jgi:FdhD protein